MTIIKEFGELDANSKFAAVLISFILAVSTPFVINAVYETPESRLARAEAEKVRAEHEIRMEELKAAYPKAHMVLSLTEVIKNTGFQHKVDAAKEILDKVDWQEVEDEVAMLRHEVNAKNR